MFLELVTDRTAFRWLQELRFPATHNSHAAERARLALLLRERALLKRELLDAGGAIRVDPLVDR